MGMRWLFESKHGNEVGVANLFKEVTGAPPRKELLAPGAMKIMLKGYGELKEYVNNDALTNERAWFNKFFEPSYSKVEAEKVFIFWAMEIYAELINDGEVTMDGAFLDYLVRSIVHWVTASNILKDEFVALDDAFPGVLKYFDEWWERISEDYINLLAGVIELRDFRERSIELGKMLKNRKKEN